jgi:hypothetical protein
MNAYQVNLVNATATFENVLDNKQVADSDAGDVASDLLNNQINESTVVLDADLVLVQDASTAGSSCSSSDLQNCWTTSESMNFNSANATYQNDTTVSQTGQTNASSAVQSIQSQVSQDGTNISNAISLANILVQIGQYASSLLSKAYTAF